MADVWQAPGLGEVHNDDHSKMIFCEKDGIVDDTMATLVCQLLNSVAQQPSEMVQ